MIYHIALAGLHSSGKTSLSRIIKERAGYKYISTDIIRDDILEGKAPFDLISNEWFMMYSEFSARNICIFLAGKTS